MKFELLNRSGTLVKELTGIADMGWTHPRRGAGAGSFTIPNDHPDYAAVTAPDGWFKFVRCSLDDTAVFTWQIQRDNSSRLSQSGEGDEVTDISGLGALSELGAGEFHSAVVVGQRNSGFKTFGWVVSDFSDTAFTATLVSGGQQRDPRRAALRGLPEGWPDPLAEWLWTNTDRTGTAWVRHDLTGHTGTLTLYMAGTAQAWVDGEEVLESAGTDSFERTSVGLANSLLAVQFDGEAIWTLVDGDGTVVFSSTSGSVFTEARNEIQSVVLDPDLGPFDWGSSYPSPGGLGGTWTLTFRDQTTAAIQYDAAAAGVKSALEALSNIDTVTVTGSGTNGSPWLVEFSGATVAAKPHPTMTMVHTDLRHDHATTKVTRTQTGKATATARAGEDAIKATLTTPTGVTYGYVMSRLITEAKARGCIPSVTYTFTDALDTAGTAWSVSLPIVRYRDGVQLGDVVLQGTQQFEADVQMLPTLALGLYDAFGSVPGVQLTDGTSRAASARVAGQAPQATASRIETTGGFGWEDGDATQVAEYGRRETSATYGTAATVEEVTVSVAELVEELKGTRRQVVVTDGPTSARPYVDYTVGDTVTVREADGTYQPYIVEGITVDMPDGVNVEFTVDLERRL